MCGPETSTTGKGGSTFNREGRVHSCTPSPQSVRVGEIRNTFCTTCLAPLPLCWHMMESVGGRRHDPVGTHQLRRPLQQWTKSAMWASWLQVIAKQTVGGKVGPLLRRGANPFQLFVLMQKNIAHNIRV